MLRGEVTCWSLMGVGGLINVSFFSSHAIQDRFGSD